MSLAQTVFTSAAGAVTGKAVEKGMQQPEHLKSYLSAAVGVGLISLYALSKGKKLPVVDIPKGWALGGGIAALGYAAYCLYTKKGLDAGALPLPGQPEAKGGGEKKPKPPSTDMGPEAGMYPEGYVQNPLKQGIMEPY